LIFLQKIQPPILHIIFKKSQNSNELKIKGVENMARNTNKPAVQGASNFLDQFKFEVANELGMSNYNQADKGSLSSRENGYVGGYMVRKMIQFAEQNMGTK